METVKIQIDGKEKDVSKKLYIKAKCGDLKNFGYTNLTEKEVAIQLEKILAGKELDIIGMFMKDDIVIPK